MARSMLSFGIEYERAFSTAFWRARFAAGSGPPSFAATVIARESLVKSAPRFASAAPFLCLIDDHLLCPDIPRLPGGRRLPAGGAGLRHRLTPLAARSSARSARPCLVVPSFALLACLARRRRPGK